MVIRFPLRLSIAKPPLQDRLETHASGLNRADSRRLTRREVEHRERMLQHLQLVERHR